MDFLSDGLLSEPVITEMLELIKQKVATFAFIDKLALEQSADSYLMDVAAGLALRLSGHVWTEHLVDDDINVGFDFPATWIQHLRKRLGFQYETALHRKSVNVRQFLAYPNAAIRVRSSKAYFKMLGKPYVNEDYEVWSDD